MSPDFDIQAVLTDVGNVVFPVHEGRCCRILSQLSGYDAEELRHMLRVGPHVSARVDTGFWAMRDLYDCCLASLQRFITWEQFVDAWQALLGEDYPRVRRAYEALPPEIALHTLTNTNDLHLEYLKQHWLFERSVGFWASCEIGLVKPRPDIYKFVIDKIGLHPSRILYFDDDPANCEMGRQMGLQTVQVTNPQVVVDTLDEFNVPLA